METTDLTPIILKNIQADLVDLRSTVSAEIGRLDGKIDKLDGKVDTLDVKLDRVEARLQATIGLVDTRLDRLYARVVESDIRMTTSQQEMRVVIDKVLQFLDDHGSIEHRVDRCERDIGDLKARVF